MNEEQLKQHMMRIETEIQNIRTQIQSLNDRMSILERVMAEDVAQAKKNRSNILMEELI